MKHIPLFCLLLVLVMTPVCLAQDVEETFDAVRKTVDAAEKAALLAQEQAKATASSTQAAPFVQKNIDYVWTICAAVLVFFMQAGFCMLETGLSRSKNCLNVAMKNVLDFTCTVIFFLFFGFTFMFGASHAGWIGLDNFQIWKFDGDSPIWVFFFFQAMFAGTSCTIASGAMAERTKFMGYLAYACVLSGFVYPIFGHWAWGSFGGGYEEGFGGTQGWLEAMGFHDFAGSSVVHGIGGATALAGIIILGPRIGRFGKDGTPRYLPGHNFPLVTLGTLILWMAWFGFNGGSTLKGDASIGRICVNTALAGAVGCWSGLIVFWLARGTPSPLVAMNGILGGLVAITACCDCVNPLSAVLIGAVAGVVATWGTLLLDALRLDDVVGAVPVHLFNGVWGTICVGLFHEDGFDLNRLGIQTFGALAISGGAFIVGLVMFKLIDVFIGLRASEPAQVDGLDFTEHSSNAYPDFLTSER